MIHGRITEIVDQRDLAPVSVMGMLEVQDLDPGKGRAKVTMMIEEVDADKISTISSLTHRDVCLVTREQYEEFLRFKSEQILGA